MRLEVQLEKTFPGFRFQAEFEVAGDRIGVFGPSGSGKSTLIHLLAGLLEPDAGRILLDGRTLYCSREGTDQPPEHRGLGMVFQQGCLFPHLSVKRNLFYGYHRIPRRDRRIDPQTLSRVLALEPLLNRGVNALSGGERQRVALGRALLTCPRLLLLDEPLTGLDEGLKHQILPYLRAVSDRFSIPHLFVSHSFHEMRLMSDRVLVMGGGRLEEHLATEMLARRRLGIDSGGYANLLHLRQPRPFQDLWSYRWGNSQLTLTEQTSDEEVVAELSSKDIALFKRHPEAVSARNLFRCRVAGLFEAGNRVGVELECPGGTLVSQVVREAVRELEITEGCDVYAAIKASAFRILFGEPVDGFSRLAR